MQPLSAAEADLPSSFFLENYYYSIIHGSDRARVTKSCTGKIQSDSNEPDYLIMIVDEQLLPCISKIKLAYSRIYGRGRAQGVTKSWTGKIQWISGTQMNQIFCENDRGRTASITGRTTYYRSIIFLWKWSDVSHKILLGRDSFIHWMSDPNNESDYLVE